MKSIFVAITVLALAPLACGFTINLPVDKITTGPSQEEQIYVPHQGVEVVDLLLSFGAGELKIQPGATSALVLGKATYNVDEFKPKYTLDGSKVKLQTGNLEIKGIPNFQGDIVNKWDLALGSQPMNLNIQAGAYQGDIELGGLALQTLEVTDGASEVNLKFSLPNLVEMDYLHYMTGASKVKLSNLGNANFSTMLFRSGAGDYTLDFSGGLKRDTLVVVESGISQVVIIVPEGMSARVIFKGGLTNIDTLGSWQKSNGQYVLQGSGPLLTINVDMGAGNLELRTSH
jgi:hypothetical protein